MIGIFVSILLGWLWYRASNRMVLGKFFLISNILVVFFAAGMLSQATGEFIELG